MWAINGPVTMGCLSNETYTKKNSGGMYVHQNTLINVKVCLSTNQKDFIILKTSIAYIQNIS